MFETAELGHRLSKKAFKKREPSLRQALLEQQFRLREADFPVIVVFAGVDGAGKGDTVKLLNSWMDPRHIVTRAFDSPSDATRERPLFWRYWAKLPPRGRIGLYLSTWYSQPLLGRVYGKLDAPEFNKALDDIQDFERMLADDGALILKFWLHLGREAQEVRFKSLEADPLTEWRVSEKDWEHWRMYDRFVSAAEQLITRTSAVHAPWHIVEGQDASYRSVRIGELLLGALTERLDAWERRRSAPAPEADSEADNRASAAAEPPALSEQLTVLSKLDMTLDLERDEYRRQLREQQARLNTLHRQARQRGVTTVMAFEGWDAAGKGGAIRRLAAAMDIRYVRIIPIAAPTDEERAHQYLWRFWRHLPRAGRVLIFDRSWYGRVLVERVEGFASEREWKRAYAEINVFESQLIEHGIVLLKFWLHITPEEQLRRFEERAATPHKRWKLTDEDWRNREKWDEYALAVHDMVERTSTHLAPWILVEANSKRYARVKVITSVCDALEAALNRIDLSEQAP